MSSPRVLVEDMLASRFQFLVSIDVEASSLRGRTAPTQVCELIKDGNRNVNS